MQAAQRLALNKRLEEMDIKARKTITEAPYEMATAGQIFFVQLTKETPLFFYVRYPLQVRNKRNKKKVN